MCYGGSRKGETPVGAPKKYTPKGLEKAVNKYFRSISRTVTATEPKPTGKLDKYGHMIYEDVTVLNDLGKPVEYTEFIVPPTVADLCLFLKIDKSTWNNYSNDPEYFDTTTRARGRMHAYLERESLIRPGKNLKGVIFNLENNYSGDKNKAPDGVTIQVTLTD